MTKDAARLVLVVEDDVSVRRPLVKFLEMHGFSVVTAETSDEGLDSLKKHRVVAAVVDLRLRKGSGRDVVAAAPTEIPVIIFSGVPSESAELERSRPRTFVSSRSPISRWCSSSRRSRKCSLSRVRSRNPEASSFYRFPSSL